MSFKPISDSVFIEDNSTLNLLLAIAPKKQMELVCSINKAGDAWQIQAQIICTISENQTQSPQKFACNLGSVKLEPMETRTIGAWKEVFSRSGGDQWNLAKMHLEDDNGRRMNAVETLAKYANQELVEITAYGNGVSVKSDYLTLKV